jgi:membrane protein YqaA with SNARE-associated domain
MDIGTINIIAFFSCLLGLGVGYWLLRWGKREMAILAGERQRVFKRRLNLWGRRANAFAIFIGGVAILSYSLFALLALLGRR